MRRYARRLTAIPALSVAALAALAAVAPACTDVVEDPPPVAPETDVQRIGGGSQSGRIDLLLAIDNSIGMADKQQLLSASVPDLVFRLTRPNCIDDSGVATGEIADEAGQCPSGTTPETPPARDINIGVISSSLGDLTTGACGSPSVLYPDDRGHLLTRGPSDTVPTYQDKGFLAWDPDSTRGGETDPDALVDDLADMVVGVDQVGCGYEMPLEAIVRFLVDPDPYDALTASAGSGVLERVGTDEVVLAQRADFLRPDSSVLVVLLSDENV